MNLIRSNNSKSSSTFQNKLKNLEEKVLPDIHTDSSINVDVFERYVNQITSSNITLIQNIKEHTNNDTNSFNQLVTSLYTSIMNKEKNPIVINNNDFKYEDYYGCLINKSREIIENKETKNKYNLFTLNVLEFIFKKLNSNSEDIYKLKILHETKQIYSKIAAKTQTNNIEIVDTFFANILGKNVITQLLNAFFKKQLIFKEMYIGFYKKYFMGWNGIAKMYLGYGLEKGVSGVKKIVGDVKNLIKNNPKPYQIGGNENNKPEKIKMHLFSLSIIYLLNKDFITYNKNTDFDFFYELLVYHKYINTKFIELISLSIIIEFTLQKEKEYQGKKNIPFSKVDLENYIYNIIFISSSENSSLINVSKKNNVQTISQNSSKRKKEFSNECQISFIQDLIKIMKIKVYESLYYTDSFDSTESIFSKFKGISDSGMLSVILSYRDPITLIMSSNFVSNNLIGLIKQVVTKNNDKVDNKALNITSLRLYNRLIMIPNVFTMILISTDIETNLLDS